MRKISYFLFFELILRCDPLWCHDFQLNLILHTYSSQNQLFTSLVELSLCLVFGEWLILEVVMAFSNGTVIASVLEVTNLWRWTPRKVAYLRLCGGERKSERHLDSQIRRWSETVSVEIFSKNQVQIENALETCSSIFPNLKRAKTLLPECISMSSVTKKV